MMRGLAIFTIGIGMWLIAGCTLDQASPIKEGDGKSVVESKGQSVQAVGASEEVEAEAEAEEKEKPVSLIQLPLPAENSRDRIGEITHVVVHFVSNARNRPEDPYDVNEVARVFIENGISSHYLIDRVGRVYQMVGEDRVAFHAGKGSLSRFPAYENELNEFSIGIELMGIGTREEMEPMVPGEIYDSIDHGNIGFTDAQYESLNVLLEEIWSRNPGILRDRQHVIGHDEYAPGRKSDPGSLFDWSKVEFGGK